MVINKTYSNDSLYPDKWDKPTITYIPTSTIDENNIDSMSDIEGTHVGGHDAVITNFIGNDKERFIPPLYPVTQKSGYGVNSNYGYLNTTTNFLDGKDILDDFYYPSQQYNLNINSNDTGSKDVIGGGNKRYYNVVDSIKGNGRIISSNKDISPYINNINSNDISTCNGCSCCGGVVNDDNVNNRIKKGTKNIIDRRDGNSKTQTVDRDYNSVAYMSSNDYNKKKFHPHYTHVNNPNALNSITKQPNQISLMQQLSTPIFAQPSIEPISIMPLTNSNDDSKIPQLEPRYTSVYSPTNAYTLASTPMPNTDNYYIDSIYRNFSPILISQNGKELGGYRYDEIKTGQLAKNGEPFISYSSKNKYNSINRIIFIFVVIIIIFLIIKYNLI